MKFQYECSECGAEIEIEDGDAKCQCPDCQKQFAVNPDPEFTDGRWRDLTTLTPAQKEA